jgi:hypothetical protein
MKVMKHKMTSKVLNHYRLPTLILKVMKIPTNLTEKEREI